MSRAWRHSRGNNSYQTPEEEAAMQEQLDRHKQMYRSGNVVQLYNVLIAVSGESERELDRMQRIIETRCRRIRMKMRVVKGRRRQLPAMLTATLGVNHL